jgi:hypothetical protein
LAAGGLMTAWYLECVLAGFVPPLLAAALWVRCAATRPIRQRVSHRSRAGATRQP